MEEKRIISISDIEDALNDIIIEHPNLAFSVQTKTYLGVDDDLNDIYIANIGSLTHPMYITGTEEKINEQIEELHRQIRDLLNKSSNE